MTEIKGIIAAMHTAMHEDGSINEAELRRQINRQIDAGVDAVFCLGTNGEFYIMSAEEKIRVMEIFVDEVKGRVPVYAGTGCISTEETVALSGKAQEIGVDALAHVVECYTSKKATPLSDTYAAAGAKLIFRNIEQAYKNPSDMEAKNNLLLGAFYGGVAITGSGTTAVHALSYPLGGKYHIPHGVSNAILFAHVMAFNKDACAERLAQLCDAVYPEQSAGSGEEKADYMIERIAAIVKNTDIPTNLEAFGVKMEDLDFLVDAGSRQQRLLVNNMKELSLEDIRSIYLNVLKED